MAVVAFLVPFFSPARASAQVSLDPAAARFAQAWMDADTRSLGEMLVTSGVRLHLNGEDHLSLPPRQVQAALKDLFARYPEGETELSRIVHSQADPRQGFADLLWRTGTRGGTMVSFNLFVGFALEGESWRVSEIRVLPSHDPPFVPPNP